MRWLWAVAVAACGSGKAVPDAAIPVPLDGPFGCGSAVCLDQQVCVTDETDPPFTSCADVPAGCVLYDCAQYLIDCPGCGNCGCADLYCSDTPTMRLRVVSVNGRNVGCSY